MPYFSKRVAPKQAAQKLKVFDFKLNGKVVVTTWQLELIFYASVAPSIISPFYYEHMIRCAIPMHTNGGEQR